MRSAYTVRLRRLFYRAVQPVAHKVAMAERATGALQSESLYPNLELQGPWSSWDPSLYQLEKKNMPVLVAGLGGMDHERVFSS